MMDEQYGSTEGELGTLTFPYWSAADDHDHHDFSFSSSTASTISSARTSLARSSLTLSFNDRTPTATLTKSNHDLPHLPSPPPPPPRPHRSSDPHWSAIKAATTLSSTGSLHLRHLKLLRLLGTGNLGRVFLCRLRDDDDEGRCFALKVVDRDSLSAKKLSHATTEADILASLDHPFLPTLYARIHASRYTCLLIDYCPAGDLHSLLRTHPHGLPLPTLKFLAAEVLVALEYLHSLGIVYRDLKPENILLRADGHIMLSDFDLCFKAHVVPKLLVHRSRTTRPSSSCFGCARPEHEEQVVTEYVAEPTEALSRSCVGTHEYLAPELVTGSGHGNGVDWWALGVLIYELMYGTTPFKGATKETTLRNIASTRQARFPTDNDSTTKSSKASATARDLVEKLLVKDPRRRLGCSAGAADVKRHPFFKGIKWALIRNYAPPDDLMADLALRILRTSPPPPPPPAAPGNKATAGILRRRRRWNKNKKGAAFQLPLWSTK